MTERGEAYVAQLTVGRLATVDGDGMPHCVPVCFAHDPAGGRVLVMSAPGSRKVRNVRGTAKAALAVDDGQAVRGVLVRGRARVIEDEQEFEVAQDRMLAAGAVSKRRAYGEQVVIEVAQDSWVEWGLGD